METTVHKLHWTAETHDRILTFTDKNLQTSYKFKSAGHVLQLMEQQSG